MPSALHEAIVELFRHRPALAAELLHETLSVPLPPFSVAGIESATFADLTPPEYRADLVVLLSADAPVLGIVVEVQLRIDGQKRYSWPHYAASLRARLSCPTCVLVYAPDAEVAGWAAAVFPCGRDGACSPSSSDPTWCPSSPSRKRLQRGPSWRCCRRWPTASGCRQISLPEWRRRRWRQWSSRVTARRGCITISWSDSLSEAARKAFDSMDLKNYEYKTEFARKYVAAGKAEAVLQFLAARGLDVPDAIRQRVLACTDPAQLDRWIQRAAVAVIADEVVAGDS